MPGVTFTFVDADGPCEIGEMAPRGEMCPRSQTQLRERGRPKFDFHTDAAVAEKRLSETVIVQTEAVREGLRRRSHASTFQDMLGIRQVRQASEEGITVVRQA